MRKMLILVLFYAAMVSANSPPYRPRGWRPDGQRFDPRGDRLHKQYGPPVLQMNGPSNSPTYHPPSFTTMRTTTAKTTSTTLSSTTIRTTTQKNREPTTEPNIPEESFDTNPALAVANSFAFNRPVYVYNTFPFFPGHVLVK